MEFLASLFIIFLPVIAVLFIGYKIYSVWKPSKIEQPVSILDEDENR